MNLQRAITAINKSQISARETGFLGHITDAALLSVTFLYLLCVLSLPLENPERLIWFAAYPIVMSGLCNVNYTTIMKSSLYVLPFLLLIGMFNPIYDQREAFSVGSLTVTYGWLTFISIIIRGLLTMQALLIMIRLSGFVGVCNTLKKFGVPKVMVVQLLFLHRYIIVLLQEAQRMHLSVTARGYGRKSFPIKIWTNFVGALLLRSYERSKRVHMAMVARGFNGYIPLRKNQSITFSDVIFMSVWLGVFLSLYFINLSALMFV